MMGKNGSLARQFCPSVFNHITCVSWDLQTPVKIICNLDLHHKVLDFLKPLSFNPHQRSFFLQQVVVSTDTHNWSMYTEQGTLQGSALSGISIINLTFKAQGKLIERDARMIVRGRGDRSLKENSVFCAHQGRCTYEITTIVSACTRPTQTQAKNIPTWRRGSRHEVPPIAAELLPLDDFWKRGRASLL